MTQEKHTPGPWTVQMQDKWPFGISIEPDIMQMRRVAYSTSHKSLDDVRAAVGFDHNQRDDISAMVAEQEANARLIAAAPDMLEALHLALPYVRNDNTASVMRAAIARATGEKP